MLKLEELFKTEQPKSKLSKRADLTSQIYDIYISEQQKLFRKKSNWKRYCEWCKTNKVSDSKEAQKKFKKSKYFIKEHSIKTFVYFLSIIPTADLHYILSVAKDMHNRHENFSGYIMSNLIYKK